MANPILPFCSPLFGFVEHLHLQQKVVHAEHRGSPRVREVLGKRTVHCLFVTGLWDIIYVLAILNSELCKGQRV